MINVIHNSQEDYLETILILKEKNGKCRSIDIADYLKFSRPSVSNAVKKLEEEGFITRNEHGELDLTEAGMKIAEYTLGKHHFLKKILLYAGVSEETAETDACLMEHSLSEESYTKLKAYILKMEEYKHEAGSNF